MSRKSDQDFIQAMLVMAMFFFGMFSFALAKFFGAPWVVSLKFIIAALVIGMTYCAYAWVRYGLMESPVQTSYYNYHYTPSCTII